MKNKQWVEQLSNSSHIGILVVDRERNNLFVNAHICKMFGYEEEFLLSSTAEIFHINHDTFLKFAELAFDAVLSGVPLGIDYEFKKQDGSLFWIHISGDSTKSNNEVLWTMVDVTSRIDAQLRADKQTIFLENSQRIAHIGSWEYTLSSDTLVWSKEVYKIFELDLKNLITFEKFQERVHPEDKEDLNTLYMQSLKDKKPYKAEHRIIMDDGRIKYVVEQCETTFNSDGKAIKSIGTIQDVTTETLTQLKNSQQSQMIEQIHDSIISTNLDGIILSFNHGSEVLLGYMSDEIVGKHITILYQQSDWQKLEENISILIKEEEFNSEVCLVKKSGEIIDVDLSLSLLRDKENKNIGMVGYSQDISIRKKAQHKIEKQQSILSHQAHHDALTGLPNRILFNDRLVQIIEKSKRHKEKFALLFIDLDHFKEINDSVGHIVGDEVLKIVTSRLKETLREEDTIARLGGDEFIIILEELKEVQDASLIANKILNILSHSINIEENIFYVSGSIGISIYPDDGESAQNLLKFADSAMYKAKDEGRNNYQYYNSTMTELAFERVVMETSLRVALKEEQFVVYYQPQVDGTTNKLIGMEALVRWQHPTMGIVSPAKFIPLAESTGLIVELDRFVMKTAMKQIAQWYSQGLNPGILAMNLAVKQLQQKDFIEIFQSLMKEANCKAEWIELEVTEGQIMTNPEEAIKLLGQISDLGIELAVDDFGTGYSSLAYLKRLPIDKLKIDQAFVRDLPDDEEDAGITKAVIALAQSLKLRVIAEGVETKSQKDFIIENGCENIQGYYYSKPIPADEMQIILENGFNIK